MDFELLKKALFKSDALRADDEIQQDVVERIQPLRAEGWPLELMSECAKRWYKPESASHIDIRQRRFNVRWKVMMLCWSLQRRAGRRWLSPRRCSMPCWKTTVPMP